MEGMPERILLVFSKMNRGGAETLAMNIYREIDRNKIQFDFVLHCTDKGHYDDEIRELGGKIYYMPQYKVSNHMEYRKAWKEFFEQHPEYKVVHAHLTGSASVFLPIAKKHGCVTIAHSHIASAKKGVKAKVVRLYGLPLKWIADHMFACSDLAGEWIFGKKSLKKGNYKLIKNGVDTQTFMFNSAAREKIRKQYGLADEFVVGEVARFNKQKNHNFLLDIFYELHKMDEKSILMLVGEGEERQQIEEKVNKLGLADSVIFTGVRSDIPEILSALDVFIMPSFNEGLPVALVEAQASGLPIVVSDTVSHEVKITDLVEFERLASSPAEWAKKILKHKNKERKDYIDEIRKEGYDIKTTAEWLEKFYLNECKK